jgi:hypothetical protein
MPLLQSRHNARVAAQIQQPITRICTHTPHARPPPETSSPALPSPTAAHQAGTKELKGRTRRKRKTEEERSLDAAAEEYF